MRVLYEISREKARKRNVAMAVWSVTQQVSVPRIFVVYFSMILKQRKKQQNTKRSPQYHHSHSPLTHLHLFVSVKHEREQVEIKAITPETFRTLLTCIYTEDVRICLAPVAVVERHDRT